MFDIILFSKKWKGIIRMDYVLWIVLLLVGFVLLIKGADMFVDGRSSVAKILKVPSVIIGLTILALGTSFPEAAVSITASIQGKNEMALSNIIGSNTFNLLMVIGISAFIKAFAVDQDIKKRDLPFNILLTAVLLFFTFTGRKIGRLEGIIFIIILIGYIWILIKSALKNKIEEEAVAMSVPKSILFILIGVVAIIGGGQLVVNNASAIASELGLSDLFIGLTIIAIGTSLPELVTSVVAAKKGESGLALGNAVGSSILNILFILGFSTVLSPISVVSAEFFKVMIDIIILLIVSMILQVFCVTRDKVSKFEGVICVLLYMGYMAFVIIRTVS